MAPLIMAKLADAAITLVLAGMERGAVVDLVHQREAEGKTADEITDELKAMAATSEQAARDAVNNLPE